jgi:oligopeptide/dipeptide ABC transporter ATP-binding protein
MFCMTEPILEIRDLCTSFFQDDTETKAVNHISYSVFPGECVAIIGESGSGKSVSALSILRLIAYPPGIIKSGQILFKGRDLMTFSNDEMEELRGNEISMIFQEPGTALNPLMTIGRQITENILLHTNKKEEEARAFAIELLAKLSIPNPDTRIDEYPYQFSGGMQQRAMIAMAMSCRPDILIADEPTTALDVTVQAQVLDQLDAMRKDYGAALILITHNLGVVARYADTVKIVYGGRIVEEGPVDDIFDSPKHPYTTGLIHAVPRLDLPREKDLYTIRGEPPLMSAIPDNACAFVPRCDRVTERCNRELPVLAGASGGHRWACHRAETEEAGITAPAEGGQR